MHGAYWRLKLRSGALSPNNNASLANFKFPYFVGVMSYLINLFAIYFVFRI